MDPKNIEVLLSVVCAFVWCVPWIVSMIRGNLSLLHPSFAVPTFLVFTVFNAMTEKWFGWSDRYDLPGLRYQTSLNYGDPNFFIKPLMVIILMGIAYHLGLFIITR